VYPSSRKYQNFDLLEFHFKSSTILLRKTVHNFAQTYAFSSLYTFNGNAFWHFLYFASYTYSELAHTHDDSNMRYLHHQRGRYVHYFDTSNGTSTWQLIMWPDNRIRSGRRLEKSKTPVACCGSRVCKDNPGTVRGTRVMHSNLAAVLGFTQNALA